MRIATKLLTAEEFLELPADGRNYELVKGEIVEIPPPGFRHGKIQGRVLYQIMQFLLNEPIGEVVVESGTITERDPDTVRGPDVSYYSKERLPLDLEVIGYHTTTPDLCVEVLSPSNSKQDVAAKIDEYFDADVRMIWVVDPELRCVTVYTEPTKSTLLHEPAILNGSDVLPGFSCKVADLFKSIGG